MLIDVAKLRLNAATLHAYHWLHDDLAATSNALDPSRNPIALLQALASCCMQVRAGPLATPGGTPLWETLKEELDALQIPAWQGDSDGRGAARIVEAGVALAQSLRRFPDGTRRARKLSRRVSAAQHCLDRAILAAQRQRIPGAQDQAVSRALLRAATRFRVADILGREQPIPLWKVLSDEFKKLHQLSPCFEPDSALCDEAFRAAVIWSKRAVCDRASSTNEALAALDGALAQVQYARIHALNPPGSVPQPSRRTALCLSGGGIRSATFNLGILQGLAKYHLLEQFHYLSTVSGGGFMGSWLASWIARKGVTEVCAQLPTRRPSAFDAEAGPIRHLREYSNYLAPKFSFLSADTWTLAATYLRNLLINWLFMIPMLMILLMIPRIVLANAYHPPSKWVILLTLLTAVAGYLFAIIWTSLERTRVAADPRRKIVPAEAQRRFLRYSLGPLWLYLLGFTLAWPWVAATAGPAVREQGLPAIVYRHLQHFLPLLAPEIHALPPALTLYLVTVATFVVIYCATSIVSLAIAKSPVSALWNSRRGMARFLLVLLASAILTPALGWLILGRSGPLFQTVSTPWMEKLAATAPASSPAVFPLNSGPATEPVTIAPAPSSPPALLRFELFICFSPLLWSLILMIPSAVSTALASRHQRDEDREWQARAAGYVLLLGLVWAALSACSFFGPLLLMTPGPFPNLITALGGSAGIFSLIMGHSSKTPANAESPAGRTRTALVLRVLLALCAPLFILFLLAVISWVISLLLNIGRAPHLTSFQQGMLLLAPGWSFAYILGGCFCLAVFYPLLVQLNKFSLHAADKLRLVRAYLGASNSPDRRAEPFADFDPRDELQMAELWPVSKPITTTRGSAPAKPPPDPGRPMLVINIALNAVATRRLAWQERKALPFSISPLHAGSPCPGLGYRDSARYGGSGTLLHDQDRGIGLGTAMTISGAAVSPNMGYHSSPALGFLLALFNIRLGAWLGNPGPAGKKTWFRSHPRHAAKAIVQEALSQTTDAHAYVFLSDGGHFENLGLYQMVLRRCAYIVVCDAGHDPSYDFSDLGNAIRKIRIDLGISIAMNPIKIFPKKPLRAGQYAATGVIHYSDVDKGAPDGHLLYIKPAIYGTESPDILNYSDISGDFPHESTARQFFTESQFESYRALGFHIIQSLCTAPGKQKAVEDLAELQRFTEKYL